MFDPIGLLVDVLVNVLLAFVGVVAALWYENLGSPRLEISAGQTTDDIKANNWRVRFLHINVKNSPKKAPLVPRQTSTATHGTITFLTPEGKPVGPPMPIRWDGAPEPLKTEVVDNKVVHLPDHRLLRVSQYMDIPPDETESLAVAIRIQGDADAFGWTSASYFHNWRHPDFRLPPGKYTARLLIASGDRTFQEDFPFVNSADFGSFDLLKGA